MIATVCTIARMEQWLTGGGSLVALIAASLFWVLRVSQAREDGRYALPATICTALAGLLSIMWWLHRAEPSVSRVDTLKAGGLFSAAIVGVYALWLNDRRRKVEEDRRDIENRRREIEYERQLLEAEKANHDRQRVGDEHFARAIEMLGNDADQVRVGALHALQALALAEPSRAQTVLDVLCAYLRRPFDLDAYHKYEASVRYEDNGLEDHVSDEEPTCPDWSAEEYFDAQRERQVRLTAQRLIQRLVRTPPTGESFDLDLTGAALENFILCGCSIGALVMRQAFVYFDASIDHTDIEQVDLEEATFPRGELRFDDVRIAGDLDLRFARLALMLRLRKLRIAGDLVMVGAELNWGASVHDVELAGAFDCGSTWLGHGLRLSGFKLSSDKAFRVDKGVAVLRNLVGEITDIYDPEVLKANNVPDPASRHLPHQGN